MLFNTLPVMGFVALATAAPYLHSRFESELAGRDLTPAARGLTWTPRSVAKRDSNSVNVFVSGFDQTVIIQQQTIIILQLSDEQRLAEQLALQRELELVQAIEQQLLIQQQLQFAIDNIRINTFKNANQDINTILVIVTEVNDNRDDNNRNKRYMVRQKESRPEASQQVFIVINEASSMTINGFTPTPVSSDAASATGVSAAQFAEPQFNTYTPGGSLSLQAQGINLLPLGVETPTFSNAQGFTDPALIIQENQELFVADQSQNFDVSALVIVA